ncbi:RNA polymerase-associated protein RapA [Trueperella bernardiae]|uniref:RNA polymerase-associated protein RapA n=1 Tax=Trueperella bernardiae TaxID=59561 RepID=A0A0W1KJN2_9ACTO|nr:SNF2-related protein [Trueperella bernardiae]KTF04232.1 RNA polymerase-associated protein RapA [Trueperella bernardiae]OCW60671.1 DNA helicase [Trueperella bernardiae]
MQYLSDYQAKLYAHELDRCYASDHVGKLAGLLFDAQVEPKPHQVDAALFALQTPFLNGVILADEVGLGKTIEAGIVISQYWAQRNRRVLIIAPSSLRQQWKQELDEKFALPASLLDRTNIDELTGPGAKDQILICSYEFANSQTTKLLRTWDLVVCDEAHRLRSHWTGQAKIAANVARICRAATKTVMLTATPLQNRLEELYGLVSVFAPDYFHSLEAFKERYLDNPDGVGNDDLAQRVAMVAKRTLRKDADKYIRFTERMPLTVAFTPSDAEIELYDKINEYLQRPFLWAFAKSQRHLSALIMRKRLGSSSYAVASTLERTADRLEAEVRAGRRRNDAGGFVGDPDLTGELREEAENTPVTPEVIDPEQRHAMLSEVEELREYAKLARSITVNQKAVKLVDALEQGFAKLREIGAPEKAIIFTDSTVTQDYLARSLTEAGWGEGLVLFNGTNTSPKANTIYKRWLEENQGGDLVTGILAADRRKALVDEFRERGRLMIATEAAAEGINLQFCSMLVNYDLPWNPQRIEQRIGRVHRFGQKHNVVVVNFSNKGNLAEERILELLTEKFELFTSVFGASDEVLGQIEDGLDFEKNIAHILDNCKTSAEIDAAFTALEAKYAKQINREMKKTRAKVFDNLDPKVRDKLKSYDAQTGIVLNAFERLLIDVTRHELGDKATFNDSGTQFKLHASPRSGITAGDYYFKSEPRKGAHQYRYSSDLCSWVIESAKTRNTPPARLIFQIQGSDRASTIAKRMRNKQGRLRVEEVTFAMRAGSKDLRESYLLFSGFFDNGTPMDPEQIRDLLDLNCVNVSEGDVDTNGFERGIAQQIKRLERDVEERNATFFLEQEALVDAARLDLKATFDAKIRDYQAKAATANKEARKASNTAQELKLRQEARRWQRKADDAEDDYRAERNRLRTESEELLRSAEDALRATETRQELFTINWEVARARRRDASRPMAS